jgi:hypothetical protein
MTASATHARAPGWSSAPVPRRDTKKPQQLVQRLTSRSPILPCWRRPLPQDVQELPRTSEEATNPAGWMELVPPRARARASRSPASSQIAGQRSHWSIWTSPIACWDMAEWHSGHSTLLPSRPEQRDHPSDARSKLLRRLMLRWWRDQTAGSARPTNQQGEGRRQRHCAVRCPHLGPP